MSRHYSEKDILKRFGNALRDARLRQELSQEKAADIIDSDRVSWSIMETGKRNISLVMAYRAAKAVNTSLHAILKDACEIKDSKGRTK